jgi:hypothetical protein
MLTEELPPSIRHAISAGDIIVLNELEGEAVNQLLLDKFSFFGSLIDWKKTKNHTGHSGLTASAVEDLFPRFFREHLSECASGLAFYANDGAPLKLRGTVAAFEKNLQAFIDLPHTNYFIAVDGSWCLTLRLNGDMDFGEATDG